VKDNITVLLFSAQNIVFGVYAGQVEELLKIGDVIGTESFDQECRVQYNAQEFQIIDFSQRLQLEERPERRGKIKALSEEQRYPQGAGDISTLEPSPKILMVKHEHQEGGRGIYLECPKQLMSLPVHCIHRLPVLMRENTRVPAIWGIALVEGRPIILVDLTQL